MNHPLIAIAGPTGSGKSSLALDLAGIFSGEIVNCDSLQFYRGFDIGTAKIPLSQRRGIPHHLFDVLNAQDGYSAGDYARQTREILTQITRRGCIPIIVGGTGFYLRALLEGLPGLPARSETLRVNLAGREQKRPGALHRLLSRLDPGAARRIHPHDVQKLIRAVEVCVLTRKGLPQPGSGQPLTGYSVLKIGLDPDRAQLFSRLNARVETMFSSGLIEEVRGLLASGFTGQEKPFESLGYKQALRYVRGMATWEEAIESTQTETRQYAKRQWTWFRRDPEVQWLAGFGEDPEILRQGRDLAERLLTEPAPSWSVAPPVPD